LLHSYWAGPSRREKFVVDEVKEWKKSKDEKILLEKKCYTSGKHFEFPWPTTFSLLYKFEVWRWKFVELHQDVFVRTRPHVTLSGNYSLQIQLIARGKRLERSVSDHRNGNENSIAVE
jgi:hypothetical protein